MSLFYILKSTYTQTFYKHNFFLSRNFFNCMSPEVISVGIDTFFHLAAPFPLFIHAYFLFLHLWRINYRLSAGVQGSETVFDHNSLLVWGEGAVTKNKNSRFCCCYLFFFFFVSPFNLLIILYYRRLIIGNYRIRLASIDYRSF